MLFLKKYLRFELILFALISVFALLISCFEATSNTTIAYAALPDNSDTKTTILNEPSQGFKDYWYQGEAEITSFKLEQARYGQMRQGNAVLIYVTEDFLPVIQVKSDRQNDTNIPILKLNATKKFNTGMYPYSIMQSTFYPIGNDGHAIKVSSSIQEWCGHVYSQLNNRDRFEIETHSYFEGEADQQLNLKKDILENELWTQLRIDPNTLPVGDLEIIPSFEFMRLSHKKVMAYKAKATLETGRYSISYPDLERSLSINFNPEFPFNILGWEESFKSGFGTNAKMLTSKATKLKTIKSAYWQKNANSDEVIRNELELQ